MTFPRICREPSHQTPRQPKNDLPRSQNRPLVQEMAERLTEWFHSDAGAASDLALFYDNALDRNVPFGVRSSADGFSLQLNLTGHHGKGISSIDVLTREVTDALKALGWAPLATVLNFDLLHIQKLDVEDQR